MTCKLCSRHPAEYQRIAKSMNEPVQIIEVCPACELDSDENGIIRVGRGMLA